MLGEAMAEMMRLQSCIKCWTALGVLNGNSAGCTSFASGISFKEFS
jgi:hypothetical protein